MPEIFLVEDASDERCHVVRRMADEMFGEAIKDRRRTGLVRRDRAFADADRAVIRLDLDKVDRKRFADAVGPVVGLLERQNQRADADV